MVKLHGYFKDGAIVQRGKPITVRGQSNGITQCILAGGDYSQSVLAIIENGEFTALFNAVSDVENEFTLTVKDEDGAVSVLIRFGDVYITAGQSNMTYALSATEDYERWLEDAKTLPVKILDLKEAPFNNTEQVHRPSEPLNDFCRDYEWLYGESLKDISAISVQTAVLLCKNKKTPIGIVHTSMGGLSVESYAPREAVEASETIVNGLKSFDRYVSKQDFNKMGVRNYTQLSGVYNEKIAPLKGFSFSGIVWYLGESSAFNLESAILFKKTLLLVIDEFIALFGKLPFAAICIAPEYYGYGDGYGYLYVNEQLALLENMRDCVCCIPIYDIEPRWLKEDGDLYYHPIHTVNKAAVSERVAHFFAGERNYFPRISNVEYKDGVAVCTVSSGKLINGEYQGFTIAGDDGKYYPANALVKSSDKIYVRSEEVKEPCYLTYAFLQYQDFCKVKDRTGAPLLPYRSNVETVSSGYCFIPAFTVKGAQKVYENSFGWRVGTCKKVDVWRKGVIYDASPVDISIDADGVHIKGYPQVQEYYLFGISPLICLSGHNNHIADYDYWNVTLSGDATDDEITLENVVSRAADGKIYAPMMFEGDCLQSSIRVDKVEKTIAIWWKKGFNASEDVIEFDSVLRKSLVQVEFLFRSKSEAKVNIIQVRLSNKNRSTAVVPKRQKIINARTDTVLPS